MPSTARGFVATASTRPFTHTPCCNYARFSSLIRRKVYERPFSRLLHTARESLKDDTPFRKALKDAAKKERREKKGYLNHPNNSIKRPASCVDNWELTVGIEIHAELNTVQKLFSGAATSINQSPNTHVALFDVAFPGSQPHFQTPTIIPALRAALALNCDIQYRSSFDRKHYFYQDQPTGYQITQYYGEANFSFCLPRRTRPVPDIRSEPFARDGYITLYPHDFPPGSAAPTEPVTIGIKQVQMEQDTAKTIQQPPSTHLLDFNRVSHPLIEIITLPQIHDPTTAAVCVKKIQAILKAVNAATAGMELGGLRADVNVSIRPRHKELTEPQHSYSGVTGLGQRTEIKNLASLKAVEDAIIAERDRQIELLEGGGVVEGETRGWTLGSKSTKRLRGKEGEIDYRYMPDPDIPPIFVDPVMPWVPLQVVTC